MTTSSSALRTNYSVLTFAATLLSADGYSPTTSPADVQHTIDAGEMLESVLLNYFDFDVLSVSTAYNEALDTALFGTAQEALSFLCYLQGNTQTAYDVSRSLAKMTQMKDTNYGSSWCRRGGRGAFFSYVRKADRLEALAPKYLNGTIDTTGDDSFTDTFKDIVNYLTLFIERRAQLYVLTNTTSSHLIMRQLVNYAKGCLSV